MNEDEAASVAAYMADRYLDRHWRVRFQDTLPVRGGGTLAGHTSWDWRIISISREYLPGMSPERFGQLVSHEVAHALTPEDWTHGERFHAKLAEIRASYART